MFCKILSILASDIGGSITTDRFSHLQIIEDKLFQIAQKRLLEHKLESPHLGRTKYREDVLLLEQVCCARCGKRLTVTRNVKKVPRADGTKAVYHRLKYICINKSSLRPCDGQRSYSVNLVDDLVRRQLQNTLFFDTIFSDIKAHPAIQRQDKFQNGVLEL